MLLMVVFLKMYRISEGYLYYMKVGSMGLGVKTEFKSQIYLILSDDLVSVT